jgi:hypothetical protein
MQKEVVPYEESLALSQIGFVQSCWHAYHDLTFPSKEDKHKLETVHNLTSYMESCVYQYVNPVLAPTYSQAFRWFREIFNLHSNISSLRYDDNLSFYHEFEIYDLKDLWMEWNEYSTYEEAELACLRKLIEIVKENKLW